MVFELLRLGGLMAPGRRVRRKGASASGQPSVVAKLCHGRRAVTADTALTLSRVFGTSAEFWLNAQQATDLWEGRSAGAVTP